MHVCACMQNKDSGKFGCRVVFPHSKKSELDTFVYLPDEYLADTEDEAKQSGCLAALHKIAGADFVPFRNRTHAFCSLVADRCVGRPPVCGG
jgi:hypothetical protein